ncbi:ankyrin repeat-containing domain protein [Biscogniauxia mediterranea]|nr:ankyrin repeat-containing domain protein [Biscogniauxia mediterranea]
MASMTRSGNEDTTPVSSIPERRREQNRTAQRRFRQRQQRKAATEQLQINAALPLSPPQGDDAHFQSILLGQRPSSPDFPGATALGGGGGGNIFGGQGMSMCDTSLYGSNTFLDDVVLLNLDQILTPDSESGVSSPKAAATPGVRPENWKSSLSGFEPPTADGINPNSQIDDSTSSSGSGSGSASTGPSGWMSPLHIAAQKGRSRIVLALLQHGADHSGRDSDGLTPLIHATIGGYEEVVSLLLRHGARVDVVDNQQRSGLHWAVIHRHKDVLKVLLDHCAAQDHSPINKYDVHGKTPLHIAIDVDFESGVQMLLQGGANVHFKARKPNTVEAEDK